MVKHDAISITFTISALAIAIYLATWEKNFAAFFPTILLLSGFAMNYYLGQRIEHDTDLDQQEATTIGIYTLAALAGIAIGGILSATLFIPDIQAMGLLAIDATLFAILIAVAEENLFRGAFLTFLQGRGLPRMGIAVLGAAIFMVYHFSVYQADTAALFYVFAAGLCLSAVTLHTDRLSPAILAHVANNVAATMWMGMI